MNYYEFMYGIKHDDDFVLNLLEDRIEHDVDSVLNLPKAGTGNILNLWDEESCDDFFLGSDPYIPLY